MPQLSDSTDFQFAQLSMAAYATLSPQSPTQDPEQYRIQYENALVAKGFSARLAADFVTRYRVVEQSDPQFGFGFSATVFLDTSTNQKILAIRGQDSPLDFTADLAILFGVPSVFNSQYGQLKNYYQSLITRNVLTSEETFSVAGHSLGGYLAQAFTADPAFASNVLHAYTYNAPGSGGIFAEIANDFGFSPATIPNSQITNFIAQGPSLIAGLGTLQGSPEDIFIENGSALNDHAIETSTDSLTEYALFEQIDPTTLPLASITDILNAASNVPERSLETALDALRKLFTPPPAGSVLTPTPISTATDDSAPNKNNRNQYYLNLEALSTTLSAGAVAAPGPYHVDSLTDDASGAVTLQTQSANGLAYRYALTQLNPFAILGETAVLTRAEKGTGYFVWGVRGRPRDRSVDSRPKAVASCSTHPGAPKGACRVTQVRRAASSCSKSGASSHWGQLGGSCTGPGSINAECWRLDHGHSEVCVTSPARTGLRRT